MKINNIIKGFASVALVASLSSCESDYLDLKPIANVSETEVATEPSALRSATYAIMQNTYKQYKNYYDYMFFNGEPWFNMVYGEACAGDYNNYWMAARTGNLINNWRHMEAYNSWGTAIAWNYCYGIVGQANNILALEEVAAETGTLSGETAFRYAQAHTMRAHAYTRLHQLYGPRWADSNNGEVHSAVYRTEPYEPGKPTSAPCGSTNEILKLIYDDLDRAIELFEVSGFSREFMWEVDLNVAYGMYARAALLKDDWAKAKEMAHLASVGYDVMSRDDYKKGFAAPTSEWMWCSMSDYVGLYYASFGGSYACNGAYPIMWGSYGAGAIDYTLYKEVQDPDDVRCDLFFTPDKVSRAYRSLFWNPEFTSSVSMNINGSEDLHEFLNEFAFEKYAEVGISGVFPYADADNYYSHVPGVGESIMVPFGAQFKFWGTDDYSSSNVPFMRASEMLMIEAEASCHLNDDPTAQECLYKINSKRIDGYTKSTKTGAELLAEIKTYRRFELWGEGFAWFDFKRWNEPFERVKWDAGNMQSGNWPDGYSGVYGVDKCRGWRWMIPQSEIDNNSALDFSINN